MADISFSPFSDASSSVVFQSSAAMNGKIPVISLFNKNKMGKALFDVTATDTGGILIKEPIVLQAIVVHSGTVVAKIENLDGTADLTMAGLTLVAGHNHTDNRIIPAGTILKMTSSGAAVVEVIGKLVRSSFSL
jgi:hypothetical protein